MAVTPPSSSRPKLTHKQDIQIKNTLSSLNQEHLPNTHKRLAWAQHTDAPFSSFEYNWGGDDEGVVVMGGVTGGSGDGGG